MERVPNIPSAAYARPGFIKTRLRKESETVLDAYKVVAIKKACEGYFEIPEGSISQQTRKQAYINARHTAIFLCTMHTSWSLLRLAIEFGGHEHTYAAHAKQRSADKVYAKHDNPIKEAVRAIEMQLILEGVLN